VEKSEAAKTHNEKVRDLEMWSNHLMLYSDGSLLDDKRNHKRSVGYGVVGYHLGDELITRVGPMGSKSEVYDTEIAGLAWAAHDALRFADTPGCSASTFFRR
jgi:hypothetical protein